MATDARVQRVMQDLAERCRRIANTYAAYLSCNHAPHEFGHEFFRAVGELLNGTPVQQLELQYVAMDEIQDVVVPKSLQLNKLKGKKR
jgi:hypothetical protein